MNQTDEDVAAVGFATVLMAALGPVGLFIAAVAVGVERAWTGQGGADHAREAGRQNVADHRAWLERDKAERAAWREARRDWWKAGADPATKPARKSKTRRFGAWWRRLWARLVVAVDDFRTGYQDKRAEQEQRKTERDQQEREERSDPDNAPDETPDQRDRADGKGDDAAGEQPPPDEEPPAQAPAPEPTSGYRPRHGHDDDHYDDEEEDEGEPDMATTETNLDLTILDLTKVRTGLEGIEAEVDRVAAIVVAALERMATKGGTDATKAALDAAMAACARLSEAAATAVDEVGAAREGLRPAEQAQDDLHSAGATGELVSAATE